MNRWSQSIDQQASQWLSGLITSGVMDTAFQPFDERNSSIKYFEWFLAFNAKKRLWTDPNFFELLTAAQTNRWQEAELSVRTHPTTTNHWAVEVAQFSVPDGHVGWIQSIEQVVNDVNGGFYPTNVSYWGSPRYVDPDVDNLRWYFTLSYFDGTLPARYELDSGTPIPVHALPGHPYPPLPELNALWYPAHNKRHLKLIVPGHHVLRMFLITPPTTTWQWQVSAKLSGNTQSTYQHAAVKNARDIY